MNQRLDNFISESKFFFFSFYFSRGIRMSISLITPVLLGFYFGNIPFGVIVSSGALAAGVGDAPGGLKQKLNIQFIGFLIYMFVTIVTIYLVEYPIFFGIWLACSTFFFSMSFVYGSKAVGVSIAALVQLMASISIAQYPKEMGVIAVAIGIVFYSFVSLVIWRINPYRVIEQRISENIKHLSELLYFAVQNLQSENREDREELRNKINNKSISISANHEEIREYLLQVRTNAKGYSIKGRKVSLVFSLLADVYEEFLALDSLDSNGTRQILEERGLYNGVKKYLNAVRELLVEVGWVVNLNKKLKISGLNNSILEQLDEQLQMMENEEDVNVIRMNDLKKLRYILKSIDKSTKNMIVLFGKDGASILEQNYDKNELKKFVSQSNYEYKLFLSNVTLRSSIFRHALRVTFAVMLAYSICIYFDINYMSWVLLPIVLIMKPVFGNTKHYSIERVIGTVIGGLCVGGILLITQDVRIIAGIVILSVLGGYSFMNFNYRIGVSFITIFVILSLFLQHNGQDGNIFSVYQRILGTLLALVLSLISSFIFLPVWENKKMPESIAILLKDSMDYLYNISRKFVVSSEESGALVKDLESTRRDMHINFTNLSGSFQRVLSEPKLSKQYKSDLYGLITFVNLLCVKILALKESINNDSITCEMKDRAILFYIYESLNDCINLLSDSDYETANLWEKDQIDLNLHKDKSLFTHQLGEINEVSQQIYKSIRKLQNYDEWVVGETYI